MRRRITCIHASWPSVTSPVTVSAQRNQVVHHIATQLAPAFQMMDLQVVHRTTYLTPTTISFEHTVPYHFVLFLTQFESGLLLAKVLPVR